MLNTLVLTLFATNCLILNGVLLRAPAIFRSDEKHLHKYSAVLAATEPLRLQTQSKISKSLGIFQYVFHRCKGSPIFGPYSSFRTQNNVVDSVCIDYESGVQNTLRAYDLTTHDFNTISRQLTKQPNLRHKTLLQAYYYKIAADLEGNLELPLPVHQNLAPNSPSEHLAINSFDESSLPRSGSKLSLFAQSLRAIERERLRQRAIVMNELQIKELPFGVSDPSLQSALAPVVRNAVERFPRAASRIISAHGLFVEEFNTLSRRHEWDPLFRWRVRMELRKVEQDEKNVKK